MMDTVVFENPGALHLLWGIPPLLLLYVYAAWQRRRAMARFATQELLPGMTQQVSRGRRAAKAGLIVTAASLLVIAAADPRWGIYYVDVQRRGIDVFFVLDVSRSMLAEDATPSRFDRAKQMIRETVASLHGDHAGLITVAGTARVKCPLTFDYDSVLIALEDATIESGSRGGSRLGEAIDLARRSFTDAQKGSKSIVIFSDGGDQESNVQMHARRANEELGIRIYTVGIGDSTRGARIPVIAEGHKTYLEYHGEQVWSRLESQTLSEIAVGGVYLPAETKLVDMGAFYDRRIVTADQREFGERLKERRRVQFMWFAVPAALLLVIESLISTRRHVPLSYQSMWGNA